jgi:hypothetical protein
MNPEQLVAQLLSPAEDVAAAFDGLVAAGASAVPALSAALDRGRGVPQLTAVLCSLELEDPVAALAPLVDGFDDAHDAALRALGAHRDPRALTALLEALPVDRFAAAEALGELGSAQAIEPLRALVARHVGDDGAQLPPSEWLRTSARCLDLRLVLTVATALAKLGAPVLAGVSIHLATLRDDQEHAEANLVRAAAAQSLHHTVAPGVAAALRSAALDPDEDTARAALAGTLYLGRPEEVETWLAIISAGGATARRAAWCLERWSGETVPCEDDGRYAWPAVQRWWAAMSRRFSDRVCYRSGEPVQIGRLVDELPGDPLLLRAELHVRTGARPVQPLLTGHPVSAGEHAAVRAWWSANSARFPPGKLHRWGRTFEPSAVD